MFAMRAVDDMGVKRCSCRSKKERSRSRERSRRDSGRRERDRKKDEVVDPVREEQARVSSD